MNQNLKRAFLLLIIFLIQPTANAQTTYRVGFYNLENLFDYENDTTINDEEYQPDGLRNWSRYRYYEKSNRMAKAIVSIAGWQGVDILGVCEIENRRVLEDLVDSEVLRKMNLGIVHYQSPDRRGIDVGLLYRKDRVDTLFTKAIHVVNEADEGFKTRDILYVKAKLGADTLHVFVNHWPSRYGGQQQSEPKRMLAASILRAKVDSLLQINENTKVLIMGDLNDSPKNISVAEVLSAKESVEVHSGALKNLMLGLPEGKGTHRYQGEWSYLDQIIVSKGLVKNNKGLQILPPGAVVHYQDFLLEKDERFPGETPFRTFLGMRYHGGFSDHLPVYVDLFLTDTNAP